MSENDDGRRDPTHRFGAWVIAIGLLTASLYQLALEFEVIEPTGMPVISDFAEGLLMLLGAGAIIQLLRQSSS